AMGMPPSPTRRRDGEHLTNPAAANFLTHPFNCRMIPPLIHNKEAALASCSETSCAAYVSRHRLLDKDRRSGFQDVVEYGSVSAGRSGYNKGIHAIQRGKIPDGRMRTQRPRALQRGHAATDDVNFNPAFQQIAQDQPAPITASNQPNSKR